MYFDMGPYAGSDPNSGGESRTAYKDQGTQVTEPWNGTEIGEQETLRISNV